MKSYITKHVTIAVIVVAAACGCGREKSNSGAQTRGDSSAGSPKDVAFAAAASPAEAVTAWAAAIKTGGKEAHDRSSLNESEHAQGTWDEKLAEAVTLVQSGASISGETIIHEGLAVVLLKNPTPPEQICLVKVPAGWCVLASVSDWTAVGAERWGDGNAINTINMKVIQARMGTPPGAR